MIVLLGGIANAWYVRTYVGTVKPALVTTCIQRPPLFKDLSHEIVALPCIFTSIKRPPLFKDHFFWPKLKRGRLIHVSL